MTGGECVPRGANPSSMGSEVLGLLLSAANWRLPEQSEAHGSSGSGALSDSPGSPQGSVWKMRVPALLI